jgi:hypothetical protein
MITSKGVLYRVSSRNLHKFRGFLHWY